MDPVLVRLLFIVAGAVIALASLWFYSRVNGGWFSLAGLITVAFLALAVVLVLVGFDVISFPGLTSTEGAVT